MYNAHFGLKENPFNQTPDSSFFFPSRKHKSALDALIYAIRQRKGFVVVTGEIGSGKTTVARTLLRTLGDGVKTAVVTNTFLSPKGVITMILNDLGVQFTPGPKDHLLHQLNEFLLEQARTGRDVVLIIDEAQNLSAQCLEEVRMLSNLETEKEKLIQIVLIGQPELRKKLSLDRLEQLRQRIAVSYHLSPLSGEECADYVLHRLRCAASKMTDVEMIFDSRCYEVAYRFSRGLPRLINKLCDHALLLGFVNDVKVVTPDIVETAIQEIQFGEEKKYEPLYQSA